MATLTSLIAETKRLLNEATDSSAGEVGSGTGVVDVSTDVTITAYLNEGIDECCRTCIYVPTKATITQTGGIINLRDLTVDGAYVPTATIASVTNITDADLMWFPMSVFVSGAPLVHCSEPALRAYNLSFETSTGTATHWYRAGQYIIKTYPMPTTSTAFTVYGAGTVAPLVNSTDTITIIPDDLQLKGWAAYAAYKLALKNTDDPSLAQRAFWGNWYNEMRMRLWAGLDTMLKLPGAPFAVPPVTAAQNNQ
jgi:hypothetical protein